MTSICPGLVKSLVSWVSPIHETKEHAKKKVPYLQKLYRSLLTMSFLSWFFCTVNCRENTCQYRFTLIHIITKAYTERSILNKIVTQPRWHKLQI